MHAYLLMKICRLLSKVGRYLSKAGIFSSETNENYFQLSRELFSILVYLILGYNQHLFGK